MPDIIRLVCPECDAVHRVKNITLGKLYRCKKCKSGLITMSPAILACPSCNATKPPAHIEVSQLITCDECADAPLMNVRFTTPQRNHRHLVEILNEPQNPPEEDKPLSDHPPEPRQEQPLLPPTQDSQPEPEQPFAEPESANLNDQAVVYTEHYPDDATESGALFTQQPANKNEQPQKSEHPAIESTVRNTTDRSTIAEEPDKTEQYPDTTDSATEDAILYGTDNPPIFQRAPESSEQDEKPVRRDAPVMTGPDTSIHENYEHQPEHHRTPTSEPLYESPEPYRETAIPDDLDFPPEGLRYATPSTNIDEEMLKKLLVQVQEPLLKQLEKPHRGVPTWIPVAMTVLLCALYGWLLGELDGVRQDLSATREQLMNTEESYQKLQSQFLQLQANHLEERKSFHAIIAESTAEKQRMEKDLEEVMLRNRQLRQQILNLPGPELGSGGE